MSPAFGLLVAACYLGLLTILGGPLLVFLDGHDYALIAVLVVLGVPAMWLALKIDRGARKLVHWIFEEGL